MRNLMAVGSPMYAACHSFTPASVDKSSMARSTILNSNARPSDVCFRRPSRGLFCEIRGWPTGILRWMGTVVNYSPEGHTPETIGGWRGAGILLAPQREATDLGVANKSPITVLIGRRSCIRLSPRIKPSAQSGYLNDSWNRSGIGWLNS